MQWHKCREKIKLNNSVMIFWIFKFSIKIQAIKTIRFILFSTQIECKFRFIIVICEEYIILYDCFTYKMPKKLEHGLFLYFYGYFSHFHFLIDDDNMKWSHFNEIFFFIILFLFTFWQTFIHIYSLNRIKKKKKIY